MESKVLIDTDILIDYLRDFDECVMYLEAERRETYISVINAAELYAEVKSDDELILIKEFLSAFKLIDINGSIAERAGILKSKYHKSHNLGLADAIIAASADSINAVLVTLNKKHFPMLKSNRISVPYKKILN